MIDDFVKPLSGIQIGDITTQPYDDGELIVGLAYSTYAQNSWALKWFDLVTARATFANKSLLLL
jgi:hypothetical protein